MTSEKFIEITFRFWNQYLNKIQDDFNAGRIKADNKVILFPNILLITITKEHHIAELVGATKQFNGLTIKRHGERSTDRYLNQFSIEESEPVFHLDSEGLGFFGLCLAQETDFDILKNRFPIVDLFSSKLERRGGKGSVLTFGPNFGSACIGSCAIVNHKENAYRVKHILDMTIISKNLTKGKYVELLTSISNGNMVRAVHTCSPDEESAVILAGQFQNLYLSLSLRETILGEFLKTHPEIIAADKFIYEPYLEWIESSEENEDKAINPDLLVPRTDGYYDIYDLKTAALTRKSLTKGPRRRRRFIDYVEEGAAQLANYREYFSYPKNIAYAKEKYGIELKDPRYVLVVGNFENADSIQIQEAKRRFDSIDLIDYDTVVQLYLARVQEVMNPPIKVS